MPVCRVCKAHVPLFEVADEESYDGGNLATCRDCGSAAAAEIAKQHGRVHWRERSEAANHHGNAVSRATVLPEGTSEDLWAFCSRCADHLRTAGFVKFKDGRGALKWMEATDDIPAPEVTCQACERRPAETAGLVRFARTPD
jgi:hypothetical protein